MTRDYREQFTDVQLAERYDAAEYNPASYGSLLWNLERAYLAPVIAKHARSTTRVRYLDFACGSGRVLSFVEPLVDEATGVDVSIPMLDRAKTRVSGAELIQGDLASNEQLVGGKAFELITAFRFFLNAQDDLRKTIMLRLASLLADQQSLLIFNNHGNLFSHKLAMAPLHVARRRGRQLNSGNYLSNGQVKRLVEAAGLEIVDVYGYGLLSSHAMKVMTYPALARVEASLAGRPLWHRAGVNQIYVTRRSGR